MNCTHPGGGIGIASTLDGCLICEVERLQQACELAEQFASYVALQAGPHARAKARAWLDRRTTSASPEKP